MYFVTFCLTLTLFLSLLDYVLNLFSAKIRIVFFLFEYSVHIDTPISAHNCYFLINIGC